MAVGHTPPRASAPISVGVALLAPMERKAGGASSDATRQASKRQADRERRLPTYPHRWGEIGKRKKKILRTGGHLAPRRPSRALTGSADRMAAIHKVAAPHALAIPSTSTTASQNRAATGEFPAPITSADGLCRIQPRIPMTMSIHQSACVAFRFRASFDQHLRGLGAPPAQQHTAAPGSPGRP